MEITEEFPVTTGRLESTLARLRKTPQEFADYANEFQQLIDKQFMEKADMEFEGHYTFLCSHLAY